MSMSADTTTTTTTATTESTDNDLLARLEERERERQARLQERKDTENGGLEEDVVAFWKEFEEKKLAIESRLNDVQDESDAGKEAHFESLHTELQSLLLFTSEATWLPKADLAMADRALKEFQAVLKETKETWIPQQEFSFARSRAKKSKDKKKKKKKDKDVEGGGSAAAISSILQAVESGFVIENAEGEVIVKTREEVSSKDWTLRSLTNCSVALPGNPQVVYMKNLSGCTVAIGPASRSVFATDCVGCTFFVGGAQQIRLTRCSESRLNAFSTSGPVLEGECLSVRVGDRGAWVYEGMDADSEAAGLAGRVNNYADVQDFLSPGTHDPTHYTIRESGTDEGGDVLQPIFDAMNK